jgi:hypothetical protein
MPPLPGLPLQGMTAPVLLCGERNTRRRCCCDVGEKGELFCAQKNVHKKANNWDSSNQNRRPPAIICAARARDSTSADLRRKRSAIKPHLS